MKGYRHPFSLIMTDAPDNPKDKVPVPYSDPVRDEDYKKLEAGREELRKAAKQADEGERAANFLPGSKDTQARWARYAGLGFQTTAILLLPVAGGWWLDKEYGSSPWGIIGGVALGGVASMYGLISYVNRMENAEKQRKRVDGK